jgi:hypothetical protein
MSPSIRFICAAIAVVAIPVAVSGQQPADEPPAAPPKTERRTCESSAELGSRLARVRRCRTKSERQAHKQEARQVVDRIQALKVTFEK